MAQEVDCSLYAPKTPIPKITYSLDAENHIYAMSSLSCIGTHFITFIGSRLETSYEVPTEAQGKCAISNIKVISSNKAYSFFGSFALSDSSQSKKMSLFSSFEITYFDNINKVKIKPADDVMREVETLCNVYLAILQTEHAHVSCHAIELYELSTTGVVTHSATE